MIKVTKWWWAWEHEKIEKWLEEMENSGLRLVDIAWDGIRFSFEKAKPRKTKFCVDYQTKLTPQYIALVRDDGWDIYKVGFGWYILRKEYEDEEPIFYNDFEPLIQRNKTIAKVLLFAGLPCLVYWIVYTLFLIEYEEFYFIPLACIFMALLLAYYAYLLVMLYLQNNKFKNKNN